jgi:3-mercaptopyruvate sulfurtransferase SseA
MMRRGIRYKQLSRMLEKLGIDESPDQINRKVTRKRFSAAFLVACLRAMGVETISLK